jgi:hypothetical protein
MTQGHQDASANPHRNGKQNGVRYPEDRLVGLVDSPERLESVVDALTSGGIPRSEIEVTCGAAAAERLRENTGRTGLADLVMRFSEFIGMPNDESAIKNQYADALATGQLVISVPAASDDRREAAARILHELGATDVKFFGKRTIEWPARAD